MAPRHPVPLKNFLGVRIDPVTERRLRMLTALSGDSRANVARKLLVEAAEQTIRAMATETLTEVAGAKSGPKPATPPPKPRRQPEGVATARDGDLGGNL